MKMKPLILYFEASVSFQTHTCLSPCPDGLLGQYCFCPPVDVGRVTYTEHLPHHTSGTALAIR